MDEYRREHLWRQSVDLGDGCEYGGRFFGDRQVSDSIDQDPLHFESQMSIRLMTQKGAILVLGHFSWNQRRPNRSKARLELAVESN